MSPVKAAGHWAEQAALEFEVRKTRWKTPFDMAVTIDPRMKQTDALWHVDQELIHLQDPGRGRLMVFMPPQEGKSQRISRSYPEWLLTRDPTLRIAIISYETETAVRWGREIKNDLQSNDNIKGVIIRKDSAAAGRWQTTRGGGVYCVGIGGALTGQPVDVLIIDDPIKDRAEAESKKMRDRAWDWWESVGSLRLSRRGVVVLMMTRWHDDDLAGRILKKEPGEWRTLNIPAIAESLDDPLEREIGQELKSATKSPGYFKKQQQLRSPYVWSSVFQQRPTAEGGGVFMKKNWRFWYPLQNRQIRLAGKLVDLRDCTRFITMDLATSTSTSADYTVASAWAISLDGDLILLDRTRERVQEAGHFDMVEALRNRWLERWDVVYVESRMFGTTMVYAAGRAGIPIRELKADTDKVTRALPAADIQRQHRLWIPDASWKDEWIDEHAEFPNATHDDQVDTTGYAARVAHAYWIPQSQGRVPTSNRNAVQGETDLDFLNVPM